jgi:hypothetical protein
LNAALVQPAATTSSHSAGVRSTWTMARGRTAAMTSDASVNVSAVDQSGWTPAS